jgi:hypothetical protein
MQVYVDKNFIRSLRAHLLFLNLFYSANYLCVIP